MKLRNLLNETYNANTALTNLVNRVFGETESIDYLLDIAPFPIPIRYDEGKKRKILKLIVNYKQKYKDEYPNVLSIMGMKSKEPELYKALIQLIKPE